MEETRDQQQRQAAVPPPGAYAPEPQPGGYYAPAAAAAPSALEIADRVARLLARRLLYGFDLLWRLMLPRLGWIILTCLLLGMIGVLSLLLVLPRIVGGGPADSRAALIEPPTAVTDFLRGQQTYDADLMWDSFSPDLQAALVEREITRDALAEQMESERQAGHRYRSVAYVGGVPLDGRQTMFFYAVDIESPVPERTGTFSFIFTVDSSGKIVSVRM